jgi:hypothetical protein
LAVRRPGRALEDVVEPLPGGAGSQGGGVGEDLGVSADAAARGEDAHLDSQQRYQIVVQRDEVQQAASS